MTGTRPTRRDMKRDELVSTLAQLSHVAEEHARSLVIASAAIVLLIVAVSAGFWYSRSAAAEALLKLSAAQKAAGAPVVEDGQLPSPGLTAYATHQQKYEDVSRLAGIVLKEHPASQAARWASYWNAVALKELGRGDDAVRTLEPLLAAGSDETLSATARILQAQVQEGKGEIEAALSTYESLANSAPPKFPAEIAIMNQARILETQGKVEAARAAWRRVTQEYPESPYSREASRKLAPGKI